MIIPASEFVRDSMKSRMEAEIQRANEAIQAAAENGQYSCRFEKDQMSAETRLAFVNAGYDVEYVVRYKGSYTVISWKRTYQHILEKKGEVAQIASKLSTKVISPKEFGIGLA